MIVALLLFLASSPNACAKEMLPDMSDIRDLTYSIQSGLLASIFAKELCSCHFVSGLPLSECVARSNLNPASAKFMDFQVYEKAGVIGVEPNLLARPISPGARGASARYFLNRSQDGCQLMTGPADRH